MLFALLVQNLIFVAIALYGWRRKHLSFFSVGLVRPSRRQMLMALGMGFALFVLAYTTGWLLESVLQRVLAPARFAELVRFHRSVTAEREFRELASSPYRRLAYVLIGVIVAPIGEELLFRGLIYRALRDRWGVAVGALGSALVFAVFHVSPLAIGVIFVIGLVLALAYERTGSLLTPIVMHAVNNGMMFVLLWRHVG